MIIFDGYPSDIRIAGTKTSEKEKRRSRKNQTPELAFDETTGRTVSQEKFLTRYKNKDNFMKTLRLHFAQTEIRVEQAFEDADTLIATTAFVEALKYDSVEIVGEDIDPLILLTGLSKDKRNVYFRKSKKENTAGTLYSPSSLIFRQNDWTTTLSHPLVPKYGRNAFLD